MHKTHSYEEKMLTMKKNHLPQIFQLSKEVWLLFGKTETDS